MRRKIGLIIRTAISVLLIALLIYIMRDSLPDILNALKRTSILWFLFSLFIFLIAIAIVSFRLKILLAVQNITINTLYLFQVSLLGYFFSSFLPTSIGGDIAKAFYISQKGGHAVAAYTSVFIDRFFGMITIFIIATLALFAVKLDNARYLIWLLPLLLIISLTMTFIMFSKSTAKRLHALFGKLIPDKFLNGMKNIYNILHGYREHKIALINCVILSFVGQAVAFSAFYFLALSIKSYVSVTLSLLVMPVASIFGLLPSINGMGPREMSIVLVLKPFVGESTAGALAFLWLCILLITNLIGGIVYLFMGFSKVPRISIE